VPFVKSSGSVDGDGGEIGDADVGLYVAAFAGEEDHSVKRSVFE